MIARVARSAQTRGASIRVPGDKSISHRALLLNAVATGRAHVTGLSPGADVASTASCLLALGVEIDGDTVTGRGFEGLREPGGPLDCGNSGTTMRLLAGILAGRPFEAVLVGDESLSSRPMGRVAEPLRRMGAAVAERPLRVRGGALGGIEHAPSAPSAQVKSAVLLAGIQAGGETTVLEPIPTRNHTEVMLATMGADIRFGPGRVSVRRSRLRAVDVEVPGDLSAAAFWLVYAAVAGDSVQIPAVGVNPTRAGLLDVLARFGVRVGRSSVRRSGGEPVADLSVAPAVGELRAADLGPAEVAAAIDEVPVLAVLAAFAPGRTSIRGAAELRVKESDRLAAMAEGLRALGAGVVEHPDGLDIDGGRPLEGAHVRSRGDHRVAMALAVAGACAGGETEIDDAGCVGISYPSFWDDMDAVGALR